MNREQIIQKMAEHLDKEVRLTPHEEDWEPERIAEELLDIVVPTTPISTVRIFVEVDGHIRHDETYINEEPEVFRVSYPGMKLDGMSVEVGFEFDPPLVVPAAPSD